MRERLPWLVALTACALVALGAGIASGGPEYRTKFKELYHLGKVGVDGKIDSAREGCVAGRKVVIHVRWRDHPKKKFASDRTAKNGSFKLRWDQDRIGPNVVPIGDYLVKAKQTKIGKPGHRVTCRRRVDRSLGAAYAPGADG